MRKTRVLVAVTLAVGLAVLPAAAQETTAEPETQAEKDELANANNPLANMTAFNIQNYYSAELYGTDETSNTAWLRFVKPFGKWLVRASLPIPTVPVGGGEDPVSGLGDLNVFAAYVLSDPSSPKTFGVGPLLAVPTATDDVLGSDVWQAGAAVVYFNSTSPVVQWGGLVTYQTDFAGDGGDTSLAVMQPILFFQLGKGTYMGTAPLWVFNIEDSTYNVPLGIRLGKVIKSGKTVFNMFIEPQFTILHKGVGQPSVQIFTALNMQFLSK